MTASTVALIGTVMFVSHMGVPEVAGRLHARVKSTKQKDSEYFVLVRQLAELKIATFMTLGYCHSDKEKKDFCFAYVIEENTCTWTQFAYRIEV
jgi:hypothetical protein